MKKIMLIYTGGTIGMQHDAFGALRPFNFAKILEHVPELKRLKCKLHHHSFGKLIDSSNITPEHWTELATIIEKFYNNFDGFVILHGTDTMAYSASALSFMMEHLNKPIIFTGSQLPMGAIRTDARRNLITSIELAAGEIVIPEVCIYFNNQLFRGNRTEKFTSSKFDAYQSLNYPALAEAGVDIQYNHRFIAKASRKKLKVHHQLERHIGLLRIFPGITHEWLNYFLCLPQLKAIVLETYGSGNAPTEKWFIEALDKAIKNGLVIINVSQCSGGRVEQGKYETSFQLKKIGVVSGIDLTTESALTKLMVLFGRKSTLKEIKRQFQAPICGELSLEE